MLDSAGVNTLTETLAGALLQSSMCLENPWAGTTSPARCPAGGVVCLTGIKEKGDLELQFSSLRWRWSSFIWQQMAQNHLRFGFQFTAQGQSWAGGFRVSTAWWIFSPTPPQSSLTVWFRCVERETQLLNQSNAYLHNIHLLSWPGFFKPALVLSVCPFKPSIYIKLYGLQLCVLVKLIVSWLT